MNANEFQRRKEEDWAEFDTALRQLDEKESPSEARKIPSKLRSLCGDLAVARDRMYGLDLTEKLNDQVIRGYRHLYHDKNRTVFAVVRFFWLTFPRAVRKHWKVTLFCNLAFWIPLILMALSPKHDPVWVQTVLSPEQLAGLESSWSADGDLGRGTSGDFLMFGFYIFNNIGIDFMCFATGLLAGVGSIFFLIYNGVQIGAVTGYVHYACDPPTFYEFVAGHSAPELIAATISGAAGMVLGLAILKPGRRSRTQAFVDAGRTALPLILGAAAMTLFAAFIEGFWSARPEIPAQVKWAVGIAHWILWMLYFGLAGLGGPPEKEEAHGS